MGFDPITMGTVATLALSGAGSYFGNRAQKKVNKKQDAIAQYYRNKNQANQQAAMQLTDKSVGEYAPDSINTKLSTAVNDRNRILMPEAAPNIMPDTAGSAPSAVKRDLSRRVVDAIQAGREESGRLNKSQSYGDVLFGNDVARVKPRDLVSMYGGFTRGNTDLASLEMSQAPHAGDKMNSIADLFKTAAMMSSLYGSMGKPGLPGAGLSRIGPAASGGGASFAGFV